MFWASTTSGPRSLVLVWTNPAFAYIPPIRIQHVDSRKAFVSFGGTRGKHRSYRGAFVDLRTFVAALTGSGHSLKSAGEAFGCDLKKSSADYSGPVTPDYIDYCLNDVDLTAELYDKAVARYREFNVTDHPSRVFSSASLGKAAFRSRGVVPPGIEDPKLTGRVMAAFYAGKVECRVVGREVGDVAVLDFTSQYPSLYCLLRAERFLTAEHIEARDSTEEIRAFVASLTAEALLRPETWANPLMWSLCEVEAKDDELPIRSSYSATAASPTIGWNHVTTEPGTTLPYLLPDVIASKLATERTPKIVRAVSFTPVGRQVLSPLRILGATVAPTENLIRRLTKARIREKRDRRPGWESRALGLKILVNAASYGVFVEVNAKRTSDTQDIYGLDTEEAFVEDGAKVEEPGALFCPLLGVMITSGAHLLLTLLDTVASQHGADVVYCDTDSAFLSPARLAPQIAARFDSLNPYSEPCPFLKDETPKANGPVSFFGLSSKKYALFVRERGRIRVLKGSDHGLGMYQVPNGREEFTKRVWGNVISALQHDDMGEAALAYISIPATAQFALTSPSLWARVSHIEGMRPFGFLTIAYNDPAALPDGAPSFELLPFVSPREDRWSALADREGAKTWEHILQAFSHHRDRKYLLDHSTGRIIQRSVTVSHASLVGLGKEGGHYTARLKLGRASAAAPSVFVDWKRRLLAMGRAEARRLGLSWDSVKRAKRALKRTGTLRDGHGGRFLTRLKIALTSGGGP